MNNKILFGVIALVVVVGIVLISNKRGGSKTVPQTTEQTSTVKQLTSEREIRGKQKTQGVAVVLRDSGFTPVTINIKVGTKVVFANKSGGPATVNSAIHPTHLVYPPLNLGEFADAQTLELVFDKQGTYKYHDHLNPSRTGTVVVE